MDEVTIRLLSERAEVALRPAAPADIESLKALGFPEVAIRFLERHEPERCAEIGSVRLWPIVEAVDENQRYVPGADVASKGFLVFASNDCGDAYCFDVHDVQAPVDPPVVLLPHDEGFEGYSSQEIAKYARPVAANLADFLTKFVEESLETEPLHPPSE